MELQVCRAVAAEALDALRERKVRTPQGSVPDNVRDLSVKAQRRPVPQRTYRPGFIARGKGEKVR